MIGVQEAIDLLPLPADIPAKREVHGGRDGTCRPDGQSVDVTALEERAHAGSDPGSRSQIDEPPATPMAPRADRMAEATIIHVTSLPGDGISADYRFTSGVVTDPCRHRHHRQMAASRSVNPSLTTAESRGLGGELDELGHVGIGLRLGVEQAHLVRVERRVDPGILVRASGYGACRGGSSARGRFGSGQPAEIRGRGPWAVGRGAGGAGGAGAWRPISAALFAHPAKKNTAVTITMTRGVCSRIGCTPLSGESLRVKRLQFA